MTTKTFIQDRKATDSKPETGSRYVLTKTFDNGDIEDLDYSDNLNEIKQKARDRGFRLEETSTGFECIPFKWEREVGDNQLSIYPYDDRMMGECFIVNLNDTVIIDRVNRETAKTIIASLEAALTENEEN